MPTSLKIWRLLVYLSLTLLISTSCSPAKKLSRQVDHSPVFNNSFTGFALYDPAKRKWLVEQEADRYFTPASNVKILTLFTALSVLDYTLPALQYMTQQDTLIFWGTGHPGFLHPELPADSSVVHFLQKWPGPVFFSSTNWQKQRYGPGWAWDDFPYAYQAERSPFPVHGNLVQFTGTSASQPVPQPDYFRRHLRYIPGGGWVQRSESGNAFSYNGAKREGNNRSIPFQYSDTLLVNLLSKELQRPVHLLDTPLLPDSTVQFLPGKQPADSIYQLMMQRSDNFIAEQLLLMAAGRLSNQLYVDTAINYAQTLLADLSQPPIWVDGSGLSRYNMLTPRSLVRVLEKLWQLTDRERLLNIFPAGGVSGTIESFYRGERGPYVFAKTGTLRHNHCLSGYLRTRSGRWLIFSFMHNHYAGGSGPIKKEMEGMLRRIYEEF